MWSTMLPTHSASGGSLCVVRAGPSKTAGGASTANQPIKVVCAQILPGAHCPIIKVAVAWRLQFSFLGI